MLNEPYATKKTLALSLISSLPYQYYNDSPSIRQYTNWELIDKKTSTKPPEPDTYSSVPSQIFDLYDAVFRLRNEEVVFEKTSNEIVAELRNPVETEVFNLFSPEEGKLMAKHIASVDKALVISVRRGANVKIAIIVDSPTSGGRFYHVLVKAEENSVSNIDVLSLIGEVGSGGVSLTNEYIIDKGSTVNSTLISSRLDNGVFVGWRRALVMNEARLSYKTIGIGGILRIQDESVQRGDGSSGIYKAFIFSSSNGYVDYITNSVNQGEYTYTDILVRGAALSGKLYHRGTVKATEQARNSVNKLTSRLIPLEREAEVVSVPSLEVDTDIVEEASHSTDISSISTEELFYLQSRGLDISESIELLLHSYIEDVVGSTNRLFYEWLGKELLGSLNIYPGRKAY